MYTYKDFATEKIRKTRGKFGGWTEPTGLLAVKYAIFKNKRGTVLVPAYLLTTETRQAIAQLEAGNSQADTASTIYLCHFAFTVAHYPGRPRFLGGCSILQQRSC